MTLEQLRIFITAAEVLSMTRAAERLHLSQPAVSAAIGALEKRYDIRIFDRVGRRLELTEAGRLFLPEAMAVISSARGARQVLDDLSGLVRGEVRIAASQTVASYWLPTRMAKFVSDAPDIQLRLAVGNTAQAAALVFEGGADLGIVEGDVTNELLSAEVVGGDRIGIYVAADHPLADRRLKPKDLEAATWVMRDPGSGTRGHLAEQLAATGVAVERLKVSLELPSNDAALEAIAGSQLVTAVSELAATCRLQTGAIRQLRWPIAARKFKMLKHRSRSVSRAVAAFTASLR